ncbi:MAG: hydrogenase formation protein HypD [Anaerolineae bacterium]
MTSDRSRLPYVTDFRDAPPSRALLSQIGETASRAAGMTFMEFCGGHTHAIGRCGIRRAVPATVRLLSGPGCPVCVTGQGDVDAAISLAQQPGLILTTFGDMMRVPGSSGSLLDARARGADVRVVYSPMDALALARREPEREVAFLGVGFETTAPGVAATVLQAAKDHVANFSVLSLHKLTPPAMRAIVEAGEVALDGIIGPGHVSTIVGADAWRFLPEEYGIGCAIAGFEPTDILSAILELAAMVEARAPRVANCYPRSVTATGNRTAVALMDRVFEPVTVSWRGLGDIPASGLAVRDAFAAYDATRRFGITPAASAEPKGCRCGEVLRGVVSPPECSLFGRVCTPDAPVGPCMVSSEGTCAAYYDEGATVE